MSKTTTVSPLTVCHDVLCEDVGDGQEAWLCGLPGSAHPLMHDTLSNPCPLPREDCMSCFTWEAAIVGHLEEAAKVRSSLGKAGDEHGSKIAALEADLVVLIERFTNLQNGKLAELEAHLDVLRQRFIDLAESEGYGRRPSRKEAAMESSWALMDSVTDLYCKVFGFAERHPWTAIGASLGAQVVAIALAIMLSMWVMGC